MTIMKNRKREKLLYKLNENKQTILIKSYRKIEDLSDFDRVKE